MEFKVFPWELGGMTRACIHAGKPTRDLSSREKMSISLFFIISNALLPRFLGRGNSTACQPRRKSRKERKKYIAKWDIIPVCFPDMQVMPKRK
jgi:hypothetical protein